MPEQRKKVQMVYTITASKLEYFKEQSDSETQKSGGKQKNGGTQKAMLAELRRGVGYAPGELPKLWGMLLSELPDELMTNSRFLSAPSNAEWAIYTALTLFALHQQGHEHSGFMHEEGISIGTAMARLVEQNGSDSEERILRRFNIIATSDSIEELSNHLRGAVKLLSGAGIPLDYAKLAEDLYWYQNMNYRANVRLKWGQDYYRERYYSRKGENQNEQ